MVSLKSGKEMFSRGNGDHRVASTVANAVCREPAVGERQNKLGFNLLLSLLLRTFYELSNDFPLEN